MLSWRAMLARSLAAAVVNGIVTLWLLLIAPLGLATAILNTSAVALSTFAVCFAGDLVSIWLLREQGASGSLGSGRGSRLQRSAMEELERRGRR